MRRDLFSHMQTNGLHLSHGMLTLRCQVFQTRVCIPFVFLDCAYRTNPASAGLFHTPSRTCRRWPQDCPALRVMERPVPQQFVPAVRPPAYYAGGLSSCVSVCVFYAARAAPRALQAAAAASSGASLQMTLSQARTAPARRQDCSQLRIHSPSPQP